MPINPGSECHFYQKKHISANKWSKKQLIKATISILSLDRDIIYIVTVVICLTRLITIHPVYHIQCGNCQLHGGDRVEPEEEDFWTSPLVVSGHREPDWFKRGVAEAIHVEEQNPTLNRGRECHTLPKIYWEIPASSRDPPNPVGGHVTSRRWSPSTPGLMKSNGRARKLPSE